MDLPVNHFKRAIQKGEHQLGLWVTLANAYTTELVAGSGYDWLLIDTEHSPGGLETVVSQLQAAARFPSAHPVVRPAWAENVRIKRFLDAGAQTLLLPYIQSADEAAAAVAGMRYAPRGVRGVGGTTRASGFGRVKDYLHRCEDELCLLVQVETREALDQLDEILRVDGVDGVFIGPADLSASLGHLGNQAHPQVQSAIEDAIQRIRAAGKAPGILTTDETLAHRYIALGSLFTAVGVDASILARETQSLAARFR